MTNDELLAGCRRLPSGHYQNPELTEDDRLALLGFKNLNERGDYSYAGFLRRQAVKKKPEKKSESDLTDGVRPDVT
jgi:hypothetical protein